MLNSSGLPKNLWGEALLTACHILNMIHFKRTNETPYELWKGGTPDFEYLKVWGCLAHVVVLGPKMTKFGPKTQESVFLGYALYSKAYRFLIISRKDKGFIIESRDVVFFEDYFPFK